MCKLKPKEWTRADFKGKTLDSDGNPPQRSQGKAQPDWPPVNVPYQQIAWLLNLILLVKIFLLKVLVFFFEMRKEKSHRISVEVRGQLWGVCSHLLPCWGMISLLVSEQLASSQLTHDLLDFRPIFLFQCPFSVEGAGLHTPVSHVPSHWRRLSLPVPTSTASLLHVGTGVKVRSSGVDGQLALSFADPSPWPKMVLKIGFCQACIARLSILDLLILFIVCWLQKTHHRKTSHKKA